MNDRGAALILVMLTAGLLAALGVCLLLVTDTERRIAANAAYSVATAAAADAALERALIDVRRSPAWSGILAGGEQSRFLDATRRPQLPAGGTLDLDAVTSDLQAETAAQGNLGANTPVWKLYASGRASALAPASTSTSAAYLVVWVADDPSDADGNASADSNGMLTLRAEARGPGGARRAVEATVDRTGSGAVNVISWREVR